MKRFMPILMSFLMFGFIASVASQSLQATVGLSPLVTTSALLMLVVLSVATRKGNASPNLFRNDVEVERWVEYIMERLWKDNAFLQHFYNDDMYVVGGRIVHIPQPGAKPVVRKNRSSYPATAIKRSDTDILYALDEYTTDPTHITNAQEVELSYDMMDSVLGDHAQSLMEDVAEDFVIKILSEMPQANIIETAGADTDVSTAGQTTQRKAAHHTDLKKARLKFDIANIPKTGRFALLEVNMLDQITTSMTAEEQNKFHRYYDPVKGVLGMWESFTILDRSVVAMSAAALDGSSNLQVNPLGQAVQATDQVTNLLWQKDCAARALGERDFFENKKDATYYGDVYSALLRMGGRRRRADNAGVLAYRQAATS